MVRRVILLVGEETSVFGSENIWSFYHRLILDQGHVRCIFAAGRLGKCAGLGDCSIVGAGSVKEQGFTQGGDTDRVSGPCQHLCSQERGVSMKAGPRRA